MPGTTGDKSPDGKGTIKKSQVDDSEDEASVRVRERTEPSKAHNVQRFVNRTRAFKRKLTEFSKFLLMSDELEDLREKLDLFSRDYYDFLDEYCELCDMVGADFIDESDKKYFADFELRGDTLISDAEAKVKRLSSGKTTVQSYDDQNFSNVSVNEATFNTNKELIETLSTQFTLSRLPPPEPSVFVGCPIAYTGWKTSFETLISSRGVPEEERLHYLKRYLGGEAKSCVECYLGLGTKDAFVSAFKSLDQRYGNPFIVSEAYRDKLYDWPKIQGKDHQGLRKFVDYLRQLQVVMTTLSSLSFLDDPRENRKILMKLPDWVVQRWRRKVNLFTNEKGRFPSFDYFVRFLFDESEIVNDPYTSFTSTKVESSKPNEGVRDKLGGSVQKRSVSHAAKTPNCLFCKGTDHWLSKCQSFIHLSIKEKKDFIYKHKLCYGCLAPGHVSKKCRNKSKCDTCSKNHPTALHDQVQAYLSEKKAKTGSPDSNVVNIATTDSDLRAEAPVFVSSHSGATSTSSGSLSSMIVPVYVSHAGNPNKEKLVYALLDTQSDTSFILDSTCESLDVSGPEINLSLSTMLAEDKRVSSKRITNLRVRGYDSEKTISIPLAYTRSIMPANRSHIPSASMANKWPHLRRIAKFLMPVNDEVEIGLLLGYRCQDALVPREVIVSETGGPYAQRTDLGWCIVGVVDENSEHDSIGFSHRVICIENSSVQVALKTHTTKEVISPRDVLSVLESDFKDVSNPYEVCMSKDDKDFMEIMNSSIYQDQDGHYVMPLPFRKGSLPLENNKALAEKRLQGLKHRLDRDFEYKSEYVAFMNELFEKGYAEEVPNSDVENETAWYIPHHGVYNSQKKKLRVVFDCSAKFKGKSLNDILLQGPDLTNSLLGVLLRFRKEHIAFSCDITKMFYQFRIPVSQRNMVRFLWWPSGDTTGKPCVYRMCVHIFGASSSPSCSNFGLRQVATDYESEFGSDVKNFLHNHFYVDDGLISVANKSIAIDLIGRTIELCKKGKLKLHKFVSNCSAVLEAIPQQIKVVDNLDLKFKDIPVERALGVEWCVQSDVFKFRISVKPRPLTRRGILSTVSSIYDPLGFIAPYALIGKCILQQLCIAGCDWDEPLPESILSQFQKWLSCISDLEKIEIKRCVKPDNGFRTVEFHHFCDASSTGYGACSYLRLVDHNNIPHVSLVLGKARVAPIKRVTIPRLELCAAVVAVKMAQTLESELQYENAKHFFYSDSKVVLGYLSNRSSRFHVFVANRVSLIHSHTDVKQWFYVPGTSNVADLASRGCFPIELAQSNWFRGPEALHLEAVPNTEEQFNVLEDDCELKANSNVLSVDIQEEFDLRFDHISSWKRLKKVVALILIWKDRAIGNLPRSGSICDSVLASTLHEAECKIISCVQRVKFKDELSALKSSQVVSSSSPLRKLDCFIESNLIKVGGRLRKSSLQAEYVHPVVLPKSSHVTNLIVSYFHGKVFHQGRGITINEIRSNGYWIVSGTSVVSRFIYHCVICRKLRATPVSQKMADLPLDRAQASPPFTFCGMDYCGPFMVKEGRKELKRWCCLFTCLSSRAVHLEVVHSLTSSSFINALRRFVSIRGPISMLRCDQATTFVGAERELKDLLSNDCHIEFRMNPPTASHMGGVWERLIGSVRRILDSILLLHGSQLDDESLQTYLCEVASIINGRPLTLENLTDPNYPEPLTPNHLLTMKSKVLVPPPGNFVKEDVYSIKRWRRVQYLVDQFWSRWTKEYIHTLQTRPKWHKMHRNLQIGDIVVIKDDLIHRNNWKLGRVHSVKVSDDGFVRSAKVLVGDSNLNKFGKRTKAVSYLERPVNKLVLLVESVD